MTTEPSMTKLMDELAKNIHKHLYEVSTEFEGNHFVLTPITDVVKKFDSNDRDTYPSNPAQKKALDKYQQVYNKLSPLQRKQLETAKKTKS